MTAHPPVSQFYHGTRIERKMGDLIKPGDTRDGGGQNGSTAYVFLTSNLDEAIWEAEIAPGDGPARVYTVMPQGRVMHVSEIPGHESPGHPAMSSCSEEPLKVLGEVTEWLLYHGTRAVLKPGELLAPGHLANFGREARTANHVYLARTLEAAIWGAELAKGEGPGRIYIVEPTGPIEEDPNLTDRKFRGNPTKSYRSRDPLRIVGELSEWQGHSPARIQAMKEGLERLERQGLNHVDD
ncbi:MAG: NAD(+)--rifampin ADP-ribosyltransferase [Calditrichaeota bacterium]|nr:NAD(+)--rifampin ADP-ribosyltransferase [Candidatus Cloacimonadota bacterium]MCB1046550.1 NAD(+)--rifampin ADP-ribosyltransferase [Calditrichota bacterium]MCB9474930.1 NAD(+)--rifampin ADP-ribosyltransferase [Candidatus Delongbacteria bacterium]